MCKKGTKGKSNIDPELENQQIERQKQILRDCCQYPYNSKKWQAFINEYDLFLRKLILRLMRSNGLLDLNSLHDLLQNIYQLLVLKQCQALKNFQFRHVDSFKYYLFKLASREFKKYLKEKKASSPEMLILPLISNDPYYETMEKSPGMAFLISNSQLQFDESCLHNCYEILEAEMRRFVVSRHLERDLRIFRLYILERFTSKEIAANLAHLKLKASSIDTIVVRIRDQIRSHFTEAELWDLLFSK